MKGSRITRSGLYVADYGNITAERKLARLFKSAWMQIPYASRRALLAHWRDRGRHVLDSGEAFPRIEVLEWPQTSVTTGERTVIGWSTASGTIGFWSRFVDMAPDDIIELLVLHEVAHVMVHLWPEDEFEHCLSWGDGPSAHYEANEMKCEHVLDIWGVDYEPLERWVRGNQALLEYED